VAQLPKAQCRKDAASRPLGFFCFLAVNPMIAIVDYGMGNLRSVQKGFERVGHPAVVTSDAAVLRDASRIVLPGVGAFEDAMAELHRRGLVEPLLEAIHAHKPFLGICLGLQLLFDESYENGRHRGLGLLRGKVVRFEVPKGYSVPHMGWNQLNIVRPCPLLDGLQSGVFMYFVHSYYVVPEEAEVVAATTDYPEPFCSMIWRKNLAATQFHPEKSQADGLRILKNFATWQP